LSNTAFTLEHLASKYACKIQGDPSTVITNVATLSNASNDSLTFFANTKYKSELQETNAAAVILSEHDLKFCSTASLVTNDPYLLFARIASDFDISKQFQPGIHPSAVIDSTCNIPSTCGIGAGAILAMNVELGEHVFIGANSVIEKDTKIDESSWVSSGVIIHEGTEIGLRAIIHPGVVIGADGFGFSETKDSTWVKIPQMGRVVIGDDVEVGANTTIDRGTLSDTVIGNGVKLDNLIQIGHNVIIGEHTAIVAQTGISGSTEIGKRCKIGGQVGMVGHLKITDDTTITARTTVTKDIKDSGMYSGNLFSHQKASEWQKNAASFRKLNKLQKLVSLINKKIGEDNDS
jgi:UDP-3-O-[3-hydroxymyristoyl] glucosamine N-acyltransferase